MFLNWKNNLYIYVILMNSFKILTSANHKNVVGLKLKFFWINFEQLIRICQHTFKFFNWGKYYLLRIIENKFMMFHGYIKLKKLSKCVSKCYEVYL